MSGTRLGGLKAAAKNKERHGADFYREIGRKGGAKSTGGGFAADIWCECPIIPRGHYKRNCAGVIGGRVGRRTKRSAS